MCRTETMCPDCGQANIGHFCPYDKFKTEEDAKQITENVTKFIKLAQDAHEATAGSKLRFGNV